MSARVSTERACMEKALVEAIKKGNLHDVNQLVSEYPDLLTTPDADGRFPIHHAVMAWNRPIVDAILNIADPVSHLSQVDARGCTPLWHAFQNSWSDLPMHLFRLAPTTFWITPPSEKPLVFGIMTRRAKKDILKLVQTLFGPDWIQNLPSPYTVEDLAVAAAKCGRHSNVSLLCDQYPQVWNQQDRKGRRLLSWILQRFEYPEAQAMVNSLPISEDWVVDLVTEIPTNAEAPMVLCATRQNLTLILRWYLDFLTRADAERIRGRIRGVLVFKQRNLLHRAVNNLEQLQLAIRVIVEVGGSVLLGSLLNSPDAEGRLPWYMAATKGPRDVLELLIGLGTDNLCLPRPIKPYPEPDRLLITAFKSKNRPTVIAVLPGLVENIGPQENILTTRHRIYFEPSLTSRLNFFF